MFIPIRPGYYSDWDLRDPHCSVVDEVPSEFAPVAAALVNIRREAQESERAELRDQRRAERKAAAVFFAAVIAAAGLTAVVDLGLVQGFLRFLGVTP